MRRKGKVLGRGLAALCGLLLLSLGGVEAVHAGTVGKLAGRALDAEKQPVPGVTVMLLGTALGAFTDNQGYYNIINIPPGTYDARFTHVAYQQVVVQGIVVSSDNTARLDVSLTETALSLQAIEIKAQRPIVDVHMTSTRATMTDAEIAGLPVQELQDLVNLQAGVVDGHFRGGRLGEVQYQVDGISVNNLYDNKSSLRIDRSLLKEVQVISGVFDAEYGQAMSGVVNAVLKDGTKDLEWSAEVFDGGYFFPGHDSRLVKDKVQPFNIQNYQLSLSGPAPLPGMVFLLSGQRSVSDDYIRGTRTFLPTDTIGFITHRLYPTGDGKEVSLGYTHAWSGVAKLTTTAIPGVNLSYQALYDQTTGRRSSWAFRLNPDGLSKQSSYSINHGLDWSHALSKSTFYSLSFRRNIRVYRDMVRTKFDDPLYDAAGQPIGFAGYEDNVILRGVELGRFMEKTSTILVKGTLVSQFRRDHQLKFGGEAQWPRVEFGNPGYLVDTGTRPLVRHLDEPPDYPGVREYRPVTAAAYAQDQIEWTDLTLRGGLRLEYFDARSTVPGDPANPANAIAGAPKVAPRRTTRKIVLAPRLGVAYPITERAGVHFAYGHFYQFPALGDVFGNADYSKLSQLAAGGIDYGVMGNPEVKPEKTVQYELGLKYALSDQLGVDLSVFYKDVRDLLGVEFVSTYNQAEYTRLTNIDFGSVTGFTLAVDRRKLGPFGLTCDYTWQLAQGNSSNPRETATRASAGQDPRPRQIPFDWDQRHTLNLTVLLSEPKAYSASAVLRVAGGQPYTPAVETGFGYGIEKNSGRKPACMVLDLRAERYLRVYDANMSIFGRVFNVLDTRYYNGFVIDNTGSPYYSRFPTADRAILEDPTRYYPARRIELGIKMESKSQDEVTKK